jgi:hypothetical protein
LALGRPASRRVGRVRGIRARRRQRASKGGLKKPASGGIRAGPPARRAAPLESALIRAGSRRFGPGRLVSRCAGHVGHTRTASARASKGGAEKPGSGGIRAGPPARRAAPLESALIRAGSRRFGPWKAGVSPCGARAAYAHGDGEGVKGRGLKSLDRTGSELGHLPGAQPHWNQL